jgi:2-polyprenyl-3-methyl-5-hydroxy-6-metoxy-1,4-benzoquinol methylase
MIHYHHCPLCRSREIQFVLRAKDYTVSGDFFEIWECAACKGRFTQDVPGKEEIGPYYKAESYISHSDTRKGLVNKLYHLVRSRTVSGKRKLIEQFTGKKQGTILDVGCGTGFFLHEMEKAGWQTEGVEPDEGARAAARQLYNLDIKPADTFFNLEENKFDAITLWHVLEHVHELHEYLEKLKRLLKPDGKLFIAVPNYTSYDACWYNEYWAAYDVPRHLYHFAPQSMELLLKNHQFNLTGTKPMWYDSYYVSLLSEKYKKGKTNFLRAAWKAFSSNYKAGTDYRNCSSVIYIASI